MQALFWESSILISQHKTPCAATSYMVLQHFETQLFYLPTNIIY